MNVAYWMNTAWMWSCQRDARAFRKATQNVAKRQGDLLREIVSANAVTEFGAQHGFCEIRSVSEYQQRVPLTTFENYAPAIERITHGCWNVLTSERVELLEPTSGTTSGEKLIPYNQTLRSQFQRAVSAWVVDVMSQHPAVRSGRAYWSISPAVGRSRSTPGGLSIGFDEDAAYLGRLARLLLPQLLVVPAAVARLRNIENFQYCTLLHLLSAADLTLISVWSPTYLTALLNRLPAWADGICNDLHRGRTELPVPGDAGASRQACAIRCGRSRMEEVRHLLHSTVSLAEKLGLLWPRLSLISCWADGASANYVNEIRRLFPKVPIQPKGLMATEACVSFPLWGQPAAAVAVCSHFFEFIEVATVDDACTCRLPRLAHQLEQGKRYEVVVTTGGGLYRYQLGDIVEVVDFLNQCPLIRFIARKGRISDQVGEKLEESHVNSVLGRVFPMYDIAPRFSMLVPRTGNVSGYAVGYCLYLEAENLRISDEQRAELTRAVELGLAENPHYEHALRLGQLQPLETRFVGGSQPSLWPLYERVCLERGLKLGNIKPMVLDAWSGWSELFKADNIDTENSRVVNAE